MSQGLFPADQPTEIRIDIVYGITEEEAAQIDGIFFTFIRTAADAGVHHKQRIGPPDKMLNHLRGQNNTFRLKRFADGDMLRRRNVYYLVAGEKQPICDPADQRQACKAGNFMAPGIERLDQPERPK